MQHLRLDPERLAFAMKRAGFESDADLARASGINSSQIGRYKKGLTTPGGDTLERLCSALRCSPSFLFPTEDAIQERERIFRELALETDAETSDLCRTITKLTPSQRVLLHSFLDALLSSAK